MNRALFVFAATTAATLALAAPAFADPPAQTPALQAPSTPTAQTATLPAAQTATLPAAHTATLPTAQTATLPAAQTATLPKAPTPQNGSSSVPVTSPDRPAFFARPLLTGAPVTLEPTTLEPPPPPPDGKMPRRFLVSGIVLLGVGAIGVPAGIAGLKASGGMMSGLSNAMGGVALGVGIASLLTGGILLTVGAVKARPAQPPAPEAALVPTVRVGAGTASATWQF